MAEVSLDDFHWNSLMMISQHWFRFGAIKQHTIAWAIVDQDLWFHVASLNHNETNSFFSGVFALSNVEQAWYNTFRRLSSSIFIALNTRQSL